MRMTLTVLACREERVFVAVYGAILLVTHNKKARRASRLDKR
jgi:hypothetical protein